MTYTYLDNIKLIQSVVNLEGVCSVQCCSKVSCSNVMSSFPQSNNN